MAKPLQYQSQFVPTNFQAVSQLTNMLARDTSMRDELFDKQVAGVQGTLANIYGQDTMDAELFQQAGDTLKDKIAKAVEAKQGDYVAAAKDIAGLTAEEARNPIYSLNKRKMEQVKLYEQALARNPNLWTVQDPRSLALSADTNPEDIGYSVVDPENVRTQAKNILAHLDTKRVGGIGVKDNYDVATYVHGPSDAEVDQIMNNPEFVNQLRSYFPQLSEGQFQQELQGIIGDAARSYQKDPEEQILGLNQRYKNSLEGDAYSSFVDTGAVVGSAAIEDPASIKKPKDFYNMPDDNSRMGLDKKNIYQDVVYSPVSEDGGSFYDVNKDAFNEFGSIYKAKEIVDNYSGNGFLENEVIDDYLKEQGINGGVPGSRLYQQNRALAYNELVKQGRLNPNAPKASRQEYKRAKDFVDKFDEKLNDHIMQKKSAMIKDFRYINSFTGNSKLDTRNNNLKTRFNNMIKDNVLPLSSFVFEGSDNKDLDFTGEGINDLRENTDWIEASENFEIAGINVDPKLGLKVRITTKDKNDVPTTHIASVNNPQVAQTIVNAYRASGMQQEANAYSVYLMAKDGEALLSPEVISQFPQLQLQSGMTIGEYKNRLHQMKESGAIPQRVANSVRAYLESMNLSDDIKL